MSSDSNVPAWLQRLQEPSSYAGIAPLLLLGGINLDPGLLQNIVNTAAGAAAIAAFFLKERGSK